MRKNKLIMAIALSVLAGSANAGFVDFLNKAPNQDLIDILEGASASPDRDDNYNKHIPSLNKNAKIDEVQVGDNSGNIYLDFASKGLNKINSKVPVSGVFENLTSTPPPAPELQMEGMVAYYDFESNTNDSIIDADGDNSLTLINTSNQVSENYASGLNNGTSFFFDGTRYLKSSEGTFTYSSDVTYSIWIKAENAANSNQRLLAQTVPSNSTSAVYNSIDFDNGVARMWANNSNYPFTMASLGANIMDNNWNNLTISVSTSGSTNNVAFYINGSLYTTTSVNYPISLENTLYLGTRSDVTLEENVDSHGYRGYVDKLRIFNRSLTAEEIQDVYDFDSVN